DRLVDEWRLAEGGASEISVMGPNGFLRRFRGDGAPTLRVAARADAAAGALVLTLLNSGTEATSVHLSDRAYGENPGTIAIAAGASARVEWKLARSGHWYDILVEGPNGETTRLAGHVETGRPGITDPAATAPVLDRRP
ncbi:MAG: phospholipase domain-containing protein, partial [Acetobacteraceae bacterium]